METWTGLLKRLFRNRPPTEAELRAHRKRLCESEDVRKALDSDEKLPDELNLCRPTSARRGKTGSHWHAAQKAFGWEAEKKKIETLEARIRTGAQLDAAEAYARRTSERNKVKKNLADLHKRLGELDAKCKN